MFVLEVIADDYESLQEIYEEVTEFGLRCGIHIQQTEIVEELVRLIETHLAKAFRLSPTKPAEEINGVPPLNEIAECYFWVTPAGRRLQTSPSEDWPFDDNGCLRRDWHSPDAKLGDRRETREP